MVYKSGFIQSRLFNKRSGGLNLKTVIVTEASSGAPDKLRTPIVIGTGCCRSMVLSRLIESFIEAAPT